MCAWHTQSHTYKYKQTHSYVLMELKISLSFFFFFLLGLLSDSVLLLQGGPQKVKLFSVEIFWLMWQKRVWLYVWMEVWGTFIGMVHADTTSHAWGNLSILSVHLKWQLTMYICTYRGKYLQLYHKFTCQLHSFNFNKILCQCSWIYKALLSVKMSSDLF